MYHHFGLPGHQLIKDAAGFLASAACLIRCTITPRHQPSHHQATVLSYQTITSETDFEIFKNPFSVPTSSSNVADVVVGLLHIILELKVSVSGGVNTISPAL